MNPALPRSAAGRYNPWLIAVIVSIATFMEVLDTTIANVALRHIAGSLAAGQDESTYIITSYLMANAIVLPISGWLSNVVGRKRFYMICVGLFTVSSALCAVSTSLGMMIVFRVMQGAGGGGLAPVEQSIFADTFTPKQRTMAFALYGLTVVVAPAVGPMLGGVLTDNLSWHWVFLINLPVGALSLILTWLFVSDSPQTRKDRRELLARGLKIDYVGFALVVLGFGALQIVLDRFERDDGFSSGFISSLAAIAALSLITLVIWEWRHKNPVLNLRLLRIRTFAISSTIFFALGFIVTVTTQITPQLTQQLLGYDATNAGLTLGLGGAIALLGMPIAGLISGRLVPAKWLVFAALIGIGLGTRYSAGLNFNVDFGQVSLSRTLIAVWFPFLFAPLSSVQYNGVPAEHNNDASAITNMTRNLGGSVGLAVATTLLAQREQFHHARLAEHVTAAGGYLPGSAALLTMAQAVERQAEMLSYLDVFTMLAWLALIVSPIALFLPKAAKGSGGH